jgi:Mn-dependent DtxR family transcriptional regulator
LTVSDRLAHERFPMTHEQLATILGVRRASITVSASRLQQAGLITYARGQVSVRDRVGLEAACCEDYRALQMA